MDMAIFEFDNIEFAEHAVIGLINAEGDLPAPRVTQVEPDLAIRESTTRT